MRQDRSVDYKLLERAVAKAEELWPGADKYVPLWSSTMPLVEVWVDGHAQVHVMELEDEIKPRRRGRT